MSALPAEDFRYVRDLVKGRTGIQLGPDKLYLVENRLALLCRRLGVSGISELLRQVRLGTLRDAEQKVVEALTTNETSFFRDPAVFEAIREVIIPELMEKRQKQRSLRIWSAACSTGQEPYSLAMMLDEGHLELASWKVEIVATDINEAVLEKAGAGRYTQFEVNRGLPVRMLLTYFTQEGSHWVLHTRIREKVQFRRLNLLEIPPTFGPFDLVLCRNVLIYFDVETKRKVLSGIRGVMRAGGVLMLGSSEVLYGVDVQFRREAVGRVSVYR